MNDQTSYVRISVAVLHSESLSRVMIEIFEDYGNFGGSPTLLCWGNDVYPPRHDDIELLITAWDVTVSGPSSEITKFETWWKQNYCVEE